ncbi:hypothetical protein [Flavobacterium sp. FlaQc-48]|uniref:hypothetical protein n=1 Tax=Flavobacterium sp. FlaQc-48 TaxID=3374181 RepID=UPI00375790CB
MKKTIQIIILLYSLTSFSQTIIKVEPDEEKNRHFNYFLLDQDDIMHHLGIDEHNGFYNLKNLKLDSLKTYRLYLDDSRFVKIDQELNLKNNDTLIIKLKPNPNCNCKSFPKDVFVSPCPYFSFGAYIPKEPRNLDVDLPAIISQKVKEYIRLRVGEKFYKNIYFKKGQVLDSIPAKKHSRNFKMTTRYHYYLCFAYSNIEKGIGEYASNVELDEFGNIIKEINFPKNNLKINEFVSFKKIKNKAIAKKFYNEKTQTEMYYDPNKNILIWKFINQEFKPHGVFLSKELTYNAHTGQYLDLKINEGQWIE